MQLIIVEQATQSSVPGSAANPELHVVHFVLSEAFRVAQFADGVTQERPFG